ncbi:hypothetical protein IWQ60_010227, partial [Tieghemiomyces parasiticus]
STATAATPLALPKPGPRFAAGLGGNGLPSSLNHFPKDTSNNYAGTSFGSNQHLTSSDVGGGSIPGAAPAKCGVEIAMDHLQFGL